MPPPPPPPASRLRDRLQAAAARRFVGREHELALVRRALAGETPAWPVLLLHGPGGVGKTTLLERLRGIAAESGVDSLRLDGRDIDPSPDGFLRALGGALGLPDDARELERVCDRLGERGRVFFVLDTFEQLQPLESWLRETFLPSCPQGMLTVLAGRLAPQREWITDPLWQGHAHEIALGNLSRDACDAYLRATGVSPALHEQVMALSHGHPLALSLLADIARSNDGVPASLAADVFRDLAARFTATAPSPIHRRALEVCAMLRRTTEEALAHALAHAHADDAVPRGEEGNASAAELFDWLASLNFVERGHDGLFPHDLVRDAVLDEFFAREPDRYRVTRRLLAHRSLVRLLDAPPASVWPLVCDHNFLFRHRSPIGTYNDYRTMGSAFFRPGVAADAPAIDALLAEELAPDELVLARAWLAHRSSIVWVAGTAASRVDGVVLTIDESRVDDAMRGVDPEAQAVMEMLARVAPPIPGRRRLLSRFHVARHGMFLVRGGLANAVQMSEWYMWTTTPALHVAAIIVPRPEHWAGMMSYFQFAALPGGEFESGGVRHGSFWREWREMAPREEILRRVASTEPGGRSERPGGASARTLAPASTQATAADGAAIRGGTGGIPPTREAFALAVREALRHVTRDARLAESPLCGLNIVRQAQRPDESPPRALRRVLLETAHELRDMPRAAKFWRALDLTYFRPAGTQELAAERLGLPFNTYRYQLGTALERVVTRLWELESASKR